MTSPTLTDIITYLDTYLESKRFADDQNGVYRHSGRPIKRLGIAIEPWRDIHEWARREHLDALFLHRPWQLDLDSLPTEIGVIAYHLSFDFNLTFGFNPRLAAVLHMRDLTPFALKGHLPYGMRGDIPPVSLDALRKAFTDIFAVPPTIESHNTRIVNRLAVVGAMTDELVREAAAQDVDLYVTGELRQPARAAVQQTAMNVAIIGHAAGEKWGARALAGVLRERWSQLDILLA
jgi:putative NIF3 family GTP cyclohydrolase 1 type 2